MNDRGGNDAGCFDIEEWVDTTELTNVKVAGLGKCCYLVGEREVFIKYEAEIASRVGTGCAERALLTILASCCLSLMRRNSVLEELLAAIQDGIYCKAFCR